MKKTLLPIHILIIALLVLALWSTYLWNGENITGWVTSLGNIALIGIGGIAARIFIKHLMNPNFSARTENRIITLLILFLLFDPLLSWWVFFVLGVLTELAQYFFRTQAGPLFNPAALGALVMSFFGFLPSWWGVNPGPRFPLMDIDVSIPAWIIAVVTTYVAYRYRKHAIILSSAVSFFLLYFFLIGDAAFYLLLEGTLLFFLCVMVCEPKTSPVLLKDQLIYGVLVGILFSIGLYFHFIEAALIALLVANLYTGRRFLHNSLKSLFEKQTGVQ